MAVTPSFIKNVVLSKINCSPHFVKVVEHIAGPYPDGSVLSEVADSDVSIKALFTSKSLETYFDSYSDSQNSPPDWFQELLLLVTYHVDFCKAAASNSIGNVPCFILIVDEFRLAGFHKSVYHRMSNADLMADPEVLSVVAAMERDVLSSKTDDASDSDTVSTLIALMGESSPMTANHRDGVGVDEEAGHGEQVSVVWHTRQSALEEMRRLNVHDFLVAPDQMAILDSIAEWKLGYVMPTPGTITSHSPPTCNTLSCPDGSTMKSDHDGVSSSVMGLEDKQGDAAAPVGEESTSCHVGFKTSAARTTLAVCTADSIGPGFGDVVSVALSTNSINAGDNELDGDRGRAVATSAEMVDCAAVHNVVDHERCAIGGQQRSRSSNEDFSAVEVPRGDLTCLSRGLKHSSLLSQEAIMDNHVPHVNAPLDIRCSAGPDPRSDNSLSTVAPSHGWKLASVQCLPVSICSCSGRIQVEDVGSTPVDTSMESSLGTTASNFVDHGHAQSDFVVDKYPTSETQNSWLCENDTSVFDKHSLGFYPCGIATQDFFGCKSFPLHLEDESDVEVRNLQQTNAQLPIVTEDSEGNDVHHFGDDSCIKESSDIGAGFKNFDDCPIDKELCTMQCTDSLQFGARNKMSVGARMDALNTSSRMPAVSFPKDDSCLQSDVLVCELKERSRLKQLVLESDAISDGVGKLSDNSEAELFHHPGLMLADSNSHPSSQEKGCHMMDGDILGDDDSAEEESPVLVACSGSDSFDEELISVAAIHKRSCPPKQNNVQLVSSDEALGSDTTNVVLESDDAASVIYESGKLPDREALASAHKSAKIRSMCTPLASFTIQRTRDIGTTQSHQKPGETLERLQHSGIGVEGNFEPRVCKDAVHTDECPPATLTPVDREVVDVAKTLSRVSKDGVALSRRKLLHRGVGKRPFVEDGGPMLSHRVNCKRLYNEDSNFPDDGMRNVSETCVPGWKDLFICTSNSTTRGPWKTSNVKSLSKSTVSVASGKEQSAHNSKAISTSLVIGTAATEGSDNISGKQKSDIIECSVTSGVNTNVERYEHPARSCCDSHLGQTTAPEHSGSYGVQRRHIAVPHGEICCHCVEISSGISQDSPLASHSVHVASRCGRRFCVMEASHHCYPSHEEQWSIMKRGVLPGSNLCMLGKVSSNRSPWLSEVGCDGSCHVPSLANCCSCNHLPRSADRQLLNQSVTDTCMESTFLTEVRSSMTDSPISDRDGFPSGNTGHCQSYEPDRSCCHGGCPCVRNGPETELVRRCNLWLKCERFGITSKTCTVLSSSNIDCLHGCHHALDIGQRATLSSAICTHTQEEAIINESRCQLSKELIPSMMATAVSNASHQGACNVCSHGSTVTHSAKCDKDREKAWMVKKRLLKRSIRSMRAARVGIQSKVHEMYLCTSRQGVGQEGEDPPCGATRSQSRRRLGEGVCNDTQGTHLRPDDSTCEHQGQQGGGISAGEQPCCGHAAPSTSSLVSRCRRPHIVRCGLVRNSGGLPCMMTDKPACGVVGESPPPAHALHVGSLVRDGSQVSQRIANGRLPASCSGSALSSDQIRLCTGLAGSPDIVGASNVTAARHGSCQAANTSAGFDAVCRDVKRHLSAWLEREHGAFDVGGRRER